MDILPAFRYVDATPIEHEGAQYICIQDPTGYVEDQLILSPAAYFLAVQLNGARDLAGVQAAFAAQVGGAHAPEAQVREVVAYLDDHGFLQSPRFEEIKQAAEQAYRDAPVRPAHLAGRSYPDDPAELHAFLDSMFLEEGAPGYTPDALAFPDGHAPPRCLVVPHIDFARGAAAYACGYERLWRGGPPDTVFVFGVAHAAVPVPFVLTRKGFDTPFGTLPCDEEAVDALAAACEWDPYAHEFTHCKEHSIEFQAVMCAYLFGPGVKIVPVLCSMFCDESGPARPGELPRVQRFLDACQALTSQPGKRITVIAGADLAHVGPRFGDEFEISEAICEEVALRDSQDLAYVTKHDPEGFYASVMQDDNARRVCGLGCIYSALKASGAAGKAELLYYGQAPDPAGGIVSFASAELL
jgi:MEMO1 family protein